MNGQYLWDEDEYAEAKKRFAPVLSMRGKNPQRTTMCRQLLHIKDC